MSVAADPVRRLLEHRTGHPVISLYLDLDPERFATPPARSAQIRSLMDQASRQLDGAADGLSHEDLVTLRADLQRVDAYLSSRDAPFRGAGAQPRRLVGGLGAVGAVKEALVRRLRANFSASQSSY